MTLLRVCLLELNANFYHQITVSNSSKHKRNKLSRLFPFWDHWYSRPKWRTWTEVPTLAATMLLCTHVEAPSSKRRPLFQDTANISICHQ